MHRLAELGRQLQGGDVAAASAQHASPPAFFDQSLLPRRQAPLRCSSTALLVIDMQNFNLDRAGAEGKKLVGPEFDYYWSAQEGVVDRIRQLLEASRRKGVEVIYTVIEALTHDGRDRSIDYKISGFCVPKDSWDGKVLPAIAPVGDEIVLPKGSSSVWMSTNIGYLLRSMGISQVVMAGALTDQCVESAVRDACDDNFLVTLVTDACLTMSQERHENSIKAVAGYARQRTTEELLAELDGLEPSRWLGQDRSNMGLD